ncbi:DNA-binding MarR family transcriptional regulator [Microbacterium terrae]|uniref:Transcriptional regulator HosA n=1 Tax=Microbacterium terrae TaxID=69369 RepID=A0A0M2H3B3_9MICO|nr:MarR family transcriptional regulator [Microbacterium terrae]KJL40912.1 Transcriptional regulator HosA [Microbacterium terrae]MBP1078201.1 DNA-binding MarR family transcriptional regulator [Microbacterium terrae]GLJ97680.1 MarR family transcriptional regulator [Microbacterium terrae]
MSRARFYTAEELDTWVPLAALLELLPRELDAQLQRDADLTHFDYVALSALTNADGHRLQMKRLASVTNATLPRLSHVITRLERRGLVRREPSTVDARATDVVITAEGRRVVLRATPGHVENVRRVLLDRLTAEQAQSLREVAAAVLGELDPDGAMAATRPR